jgi:gamma-glutamyltranspeptidase/glutathione hydrolase/leukotriene-C4 hydrolase
VLIEALNILSNFRDLQSMPPHDRTQLLVETLKFAYASRMRLGDPAFEPEMAHELERMLDPASAERISHKIDLQRTHEPHYYSSTLEKVHDHGTTHVSVMDAEGMGVSCTCTVNLEFGSKLMDSATGIILNNEMDDFSIPGHSNQFSLPASPSNYIKPGKRPMSSSTPVILLRNGRIQMIVGGTGGSRIISSTLLAIVQMIDLGTDALEAVNAPRFHHQLIPNYLIAEFEVPDEAIKDLEARGHKVHVLTKGFYFSSVQAIKRDPFKGTLIAAADGRKGGGTDGY